MCVYIYTLISYPPMTPGDVDCILASLALRPRSQQSPGRPTGPDAEPRRPRRFLCDDRPRTEMLLEDGDVFKEHGIDVYLGSCPY